MITDHLREILDDIEFDDWEFEVVSRTSTLALEGSGTIMMFHVIFDALDNDYPDSGELLPQAGRWWYVSPTATRSDVVRTAYKAVLAAVEHEASEKFLYKGARVYDPHGEMSDA